MPKQYLMPILTRNHASSFLSASLSAYTMRITPMVPFAGTMLRGLVRCAVAEAAKARSTRLPASLQKPADMFVHAPRHRDQQTNPTRLQGTAVCMQRGTRESPRSVTSFWDGIVGPKIVGSSQRGVLLTCGLVSSWPLCAASLIVVDGYSTLSLARFAQTS